MNDTSVDRDSCIMLRDPGPPGLDHSRASASTTGFQKPNLCYRADSARIFGKYPTQDLETETARVSMHANGPCHVSTPSHGMVRLNIGTHPTESVFPFRLPLATPRRVVRHRPDPRRYITRYGIYGRFLAPPSPLSLLSANTIQRGHSLVDSPEVSDRS
ncbi:hypothetical protein BC834DRAFT_872419, partial [Gloeopeniophorella convolvens]